MCVYIERILTNVVIDIVLGVGQKMSCGSDKLNVDIRLVLVVLSDFRADKSKTHVAQRARALY